MKSTLAGLALALACVTPALSADHQVRIEGGAFVPATVAAGVGDTITFTNFDTAPHTATAVSGAFDTGRLMKGDSGRIVIGSAGVIDFFCAVHPSMKGAVRAQ